MNWKTQLSKAVSALKDVAESDTARNLAAKAQKSASLLAQKAKSGALDAAQSFIEANSDPAALKVQFLNARLSILSPSNGIEIARPKGAFQPDYVWLPVDARGDC